MQPMRKRKPLITNAEVLARLNGRSFGSYASLRSAVRELISEFVKRWPAGYTDRDFISYNRLQGNIVVDDHLIYVRAA